MPRKYSVVEIDLVKEEHVKVHVLWMPLPTESDFYRQTTSFNAFFHSCDKGKDHHRCWIPKVKLFACNPWDEWWNRCERHQQFGKERGHDYSATDDRRLPRIL